MRIPPSVAAAGMADLDETHAPLGEPARQQQLLTELLGVPVVEPLERSDVGGFRREVDRLGR